MCLRPALCRLLILVDPLCSDRYKIDNIVNAPEVSKIGFQIGRIRGFRPPWRLGIEKIVDGYSSIPFPASRAGWGGTLLTRLVREGWAVTRQLRTKTSAGFLAGY